MNQSVRWRGYSIYQQFVNLKIKKIPIFFIFSLTTSKIVFLMAIIDFSLLCQDYLHILEKVVNENFGLDILEKTLLNHLFFLYSFDSEIIGKTIGYYILSTHWKNFLSHPHLKTIMMDDLWNILVCFLFL